MSKALAIRFGIAKGVTIAATVTLLDVEFWKALIIALVSGVIGAAGVIIGAIYAAREARENRRLIEDIRRAHGLVRRHDDPTGPSHNPPLLSNDS